MREKAQEYYRKPKVFKNAPKVFIGKAQEVEAKAQECYQKPKKLRFERMWGWESLVVREK